MVDISTFLSLLEMAKVRMARASCGNRGQEGSEGTQGAGCPPRRAHLLLSGRGVQQDGAVGLQSTGDTAEEGGKGQPCVQQCHAGGVEAAGQQLGACQGTTQPHQLQVPQPPEPSHKGKDTEPASLSTCSTREMAVRGCSIPRTTASHVWRSSCSRLRSSTPAQRGVCHSYPRKSTAV